MKRLTCLMLVLLTAAACAPSPTPPRSLGVFNVNDSTDGAGGYTMRPTAVFWSASNVSLPNSQLPPDACIDTVYLPPDTTKQALSGQLDAGSPVQVQTDLTTGQMTPDTIPNVLITYRVHGPRLGFTPGATVHFAIPGAAGGFQASTMSFPTAKRLVLGPIDPTPPDSLHLTWAQGYPGVDAVQVALIYISPGSLTYNRQIVCAMNDDGDFYVPGPQSPNNMSLKWKNANSTGQRVTAFRWVTTYTSLGDNGLLLGISTFDTTKTTFP
jgi:hypothetical protein